MQIWAKTVVFGVLWLASHGAFTQAQGESSSSSIPLGVVANSFISKASVNSTSIANKIFRAKPFSQTKAYLPYKVVCDKVRRRSKANFNRSGQKMVVSMDQAYERQDLKIFWPVLCLGVDLWKTSEINLKVLGKAVATTIVKDIDKVFKIPLQDVTSFALTELRRTIQNLLDAIKKKFHNFIKELKEIKDPLKWAQNRLDHIGKLINQKAKELGPEIVKAYHKALNTFERLIEKGGFRELREIMINTARAFKENFVRAQKILKDDVAKLFFASGSLYIAMLGYINVYYFRATLARRFGKNKFEKWLGPDWDFSIRLPNGKHLHRYWKTHSVYRIAIWGGLTYMIDQFFFRVVKNVPKQYREGTQAFVDAFSGIYLTFFASVTGGTALHLHNDVFKDGYKYGKTFWRVVPGKLYQKLFTGGKKSLFPGCSTCTNVFLEANGIIAAIVTYFVQREVWKRLARSKSLDEDPFNELETVQVRP